MSTLSSNKGFSLIELMVVLVIVAVLGTISVVQYSQFVEKTRVDEAKQGLWAVRVALGQFRMDHRDPPASFSALNLTAGEYPGNCRAEKFFSYGINSTHVMANRCTSSGKPPQGRVAYTITLELINSTWGGTPGYY
jgi:type IV pilus assembly protein PilE